MEADAELATLQTALARKDEALRTAADTLRVIETEAALGRSAVAPSVSEKRQRALITIREVAERGATAIDRALSAKEEGL